MTNCKNTKTITPQTSNGHGVLRAVLERARLDAGCSLSDLTALSAQVDPYRLDTPAGHRDGQWLAGQLNRAIGTSRRMARPALRPGVRQAPRREAGRPDAGLSEETAGRETRNRKKIAANLGDIIEQWARRYLAERARRHA